MTEFLWPLVPFLIPLLLLSIYSVGLMLQKGLLLRSARALRPMAFGQVLDEVARGQSVSVPLASTHPLAHLLNHAHEGPSLLQARAQTLLSHIEDRVSYFPALANVSTLTGLFGTVCGMIVAFLALRSGGGADPSSLAGGLGVALVATALGLLTAIPSLVAHAVFQKQVQAIAAQMEALLSALLEDRHA